MDNEFTVAEIEEAIAAARIFSSDYGQEQFQASRELERRLGESGCLEAVCAVARLEKERNISCTEALGACEQLLQENAKLEQKVADRRAKLMTVEGDVGQAQDKLQRIEEAMAQAKKGLEEVRAERESVGKELIAFKKRAEREKQRIDQELEKYRGKADVSREEITGASQLKKQLAGCGFSVKLALDLSQEFAGRENARGELAEAIEEHGALTRSNAALIEQNKRLKSDLSYVQSEVDKGQANCDQLERIASELRTEIAGNGEIVDFYHRYLHLRPLIEYLGSWPHVTFHHCNWCGALFWILCPGGFNVSAYKCPWCGFLAVDADRNAYTAAGKPLGTPVQLLP